jgi:hypothetical protein
MQRLVQPTPAKEIKNEEKVDFFHKNVLLL